MPLHPAIARVTDRIRERSKASRAAYLARVAAQIEEGPRRAHLSCGNQAHAYAGMEEKEESAEMRSLRLNLLALARFVPLSEGLQM